MKKIILFVLAFGFLLTVWQVPAANAADDKELSAYKWGYWDKMVAPAAMKPEFPRIAVIENDPDPDPDPDPKILPGPPIPNTPDKPGIPSPGTPPGGRIAGTWGTISIRTAGRKSWDSWGNCAATTRRNDIVRFYSEITYKERTGLVWLYSWRNTGLEMEK